MEIFDGYLEDLIKQEKAKEKAKGAKGGGGGGKEEEEQKKKAPASELQVSSNSRQRNLWSSFIRGTCFCFC